MTLPKIDMPTFDVKLNSRAHTVKMKPMTMKENKVILVAKQSDNQQDMIDAMIQTVNTCIVDGTDVSVLPLYDVLWMYIKLRSQSVSNKADIIIPDDHGKDITVTVKLDDIEVDITDNRKTQIMVGKDLIIKMKDAPVSIYEDTAFKAAIAQNNAESVLWNILFAASIETIHNGEEIIEAKNKPQMELRAWADELPSSVFDDYNAFTLSAPTVRHKITYKDSQGEEQSLTLSSVSDFFLL